MIEFLRRNFVLKITSIIIAFVLWGYVQIIQSPEVTHEFKDLPVNIYNASLLNNSGLTLDNDTKLTSNITIKGPRFKLNSVKKEEITPYIDISEVNSVGEHALPIRVKIENENFVVVDKNPHNATVKIDRLVSVTKTVHLEFTGKVPDGFTLNADASSVDPKTITIKGSAKYVENITPYVVVDVNGKTGPFSVQTRVKLRNAQSEVIENAVVEPDTVNVNVVISKIGGV